MKLIVKIESLEIPDNEEQRQIVMDHLHEVLCELFDSFQIEEVQQTAVHPPPAQM